MITQGVITAALIGVVITGLIPIIGGLVLMAMGKVKASSFWAGVLTYIISIIIVTIASLIVGIVIGIINPALAQNTVLLGIVGAVLNCVIFAPAMGVCVKSCMKTRTFNAALSCGLGFGASYSVTTAISLLSTYITFASINSGEFDRQYAELIKMGVFDKETFNMLKATFTEYTVAQIVQMIITAIFFAAAITAAAVFIMRFVCTGRALPGIGLAMAAIGVCGIGSVIPNAAAAMIVTAAIGIAALIFAVRMKEQVTPPEKKAAYDPFMSSVENAKKED